LAKESKSRRPIYVRVPSGIWKFFASLKLTIFVLISVAAISVVGTVVEQNQPLETYLMAYGEGWAKFIVYANLNNMYHTWWYNGLILTLALNIVVCTFERFPVKWKALINHKPTKFDSKTVGRFGNRRSVTVDAGFDDTVERVGKLLKKNKYKRYNFGANESEAFIYGWRGVIGRFGSDITHISLLLILFGALIGGTYGYKDFKVVYTGDTIQIPDVDYHLRLDKFWIDYYDSGQIQQYNSILTVVEDGKDVLTKQIWVNEPLDYKGVRFYQSTWGNAWNRVESASIAMIGKDSEMLFSKMDIKWEELTPIPDTDYNVKLIGFSADFAYDERSNQVFSKSPDPENPAIQIEVYRGEKLLATPWIFINYPGIFPAIPDSDEDIVFGAYRGVLYSGLSLNKDPGVNIVWLGCTIMILGFFFTFFIYYRRLWVYVRKVEGGTEVTLGGLINKSNFVFEREIEKMAKHLEGDKKA
jgi:cytochrome c biogenesis protein